MLNANLFYSLLAFGTIAKTWQRSSAFSVEVGGGTMTLVSLSWQQCYEPRVRWPSAILIRSFYA